MPNPIGLVQEEHVEISGGIGVGYGIVALGEQNPQYL